MINRPGAHQRLGGFEQRLHLDQIAIAEDRLLLAAGASDTKRRERSCVLSTTWCTRLSVRSRAPSTYSRPRSSRAAMVAAEIMPRSATTQTRPMAKRARNR